MSAAVQAGGVPEVAPREADSAKDELGVGAKRQEPPPEMLADSRRRSWVILSLWTIVICLGLPIWWKTTTIYRADLPLSEMMDWADGKACHPQSDPRMPTPSSVWSSTSGHRSLERSADIIGPPRLADQSSHYEWR
jgi:hypothetical protein